MLFFSKLQLIFSRQVDSAFSMWNLSWNFCNFKEKIENIAGKKTVELLSREWTIFFKTKSIGSQRASRNRVSGERKGQKEKKRYPVRRVTATWKWVPTFVIEPRDREIVCSSRQGRRGRRKGSRHTGSGLGISSGLDRFAIARKERASARDDSRKTEEKLYREPRTSTTFRSRFFWLEEWSYDSNTKILLWIEQFAFGSLLYSSIACRRFFKSRFIINGTWIWDDFLAKLSNWSAVF